MSKCPRCQQEVNPEDLYLIQGENVCEDCAFDQQAPPKTCDVLAVHIAKNTREQMGMTSTDGLNELQKEIYDFIKDRNGASMQDLVENLGRTEKEITKEFTTLRHCELAKAQQKGKEKIFVVWEYEG